MNDILEVKVKKKEINFIIWLIPIISLIVGGWLIYKYYSSLGPLITIKFKDGGGLEPKRSVVKFRNVEVGKVEKVQILTYGKGVLVYVRMNKDMEPFLNEFTKFWIVKPKIGLEEVKGLDALLSGPYIQMYAKPAKFTKKHFIGLDEAPLDSSILNGKILTLTANSTYGLSEKLPVYFKHLQVGTIRKIDLTKDGKVKIIISINKKYAHFVNDSTRFWNAKKVDISLVKNYLQISLPTIKELVFGGIVFDTPDKKPLTKKVFKLYPSKAEAFANTLGDKIVYKEFLAVFDKQNSLLTVGEAVKFRGFDVGYVKEVKSNFDIKQNKIVSYAVLKINIGAFSSDVNTLLNKGLSVYIKKTPLLNSSQINLEFTNKPYKLEMVNGKVKINTIYKKETSLIDNLNKFVAKLNSLPLKETVNNLNSLISTTKPAISQTLYSITKTSDALRDILIQNNEKISSILINSNELIKNLNKLVKTYSDDSFYQKISKTLYDVDKTMNNLNRVIIKLDKKPNSLILGD